MWDIEFILGVGKLLSLVVCMVFIEGVVASRPNGKMFGLILPIFMLLLSIWTLATWKNWVYFILVFSPALLSWFIFYICRRSIKNGTALGLNQEENS